MLSIDRLWLMGQSLLGLRKDSLVASTGMKLPEVLRPLYKQMSILAPKTTTMMALHQPWQIAQEASQHGAPNWGRRPALMGLNLSFSNGYPSVSTAVMCAKASMLIQFVLPDLLLMFLRGISHAMVDIDAPREDVIYFIDGTTAILVGHSMSTLLAPSTTIASITTRGEEISQKAKIKWAIEGDENVKFFHGILNKKRSQSQIRGVMANGVWIDDPVKDLEQDITRERFKRAVWDCDDVFGAVEYFFINGDIPNGCNQIFIAIDP
ncbi:hypothetical protein Tco_0386197 [Tanacetum coccineum]